MSDEYQGTIKANDDFDEEKAAKRFKKALKGFGTDENSIIKNLVGHDNSQRCDICCKYKEMYGNDLIEDLKEELAGSFEDTVVALLTETSEYVMQCLHDALGAVDVDEKVLVDILCGRTSEEIEEIANQYEEKYGHTLDSEIADELSGDFKSLMRGLVASGREDESEVDEGRAKKDAEDLYDAGVGLNNDTDSSEFIQILNTRSYKHLALVFKEYEKFADDTLENAINAESFSGVMRAGLLAIIQRVKIPLEFYATRLNKSMAGMGTDDKSLIRILVSRSEIDLADVRSKYKELYGKDLVADIKDDTSGDYCKLLVAIVNGKH